LTKFIAKGLIDKSVGGTITWWQHISIIESIILFYLLDVVSRVSNNSFKINIKCAVLAGTILPFIVAAYHNKEINFILCG
jgi:hypothetical protein